MIRQRWGTFSVIDHKDPAGLAPEVLLYDRLVIPFPVTEKEHDRWEKQGWAPELLKERLKTLGHLAVRANWGYEDSKSAIHLWAEQFASLEKDTAEIVQEAKTNLGYDLTRRVLAQQKYPLPSGVEAIDLVAAYQSEEEIRAQFEIKQASESRADLGLMLRQRIAVPLLEGDPQSALKSAVELALDPEFCLKRTTVYELQNQILSDSQPTLETVQLLEQTTEELIDYVKLMTKKVRFTFAFALAGVRPGYAVGGPLPTFAAGSTTLSSVQFKPQSPAFIRPPGSSAPTAMYHDKS